MALNAAMEWEVRTTGSDNNGGAFKSGATGLDYSQQDAAEDSGTDLACADGDLAAPVVTSATHNFVANDVGNIINITEAGTGFTVGRYEIVSVNANAATLDRACGADGALTGGDWYLGGGLLTLSTAAGVVVNGNKVWIQNGTYAETLTFTVSGGNSTAIRWIGYKTNHTTIPLGTDRPLIDGGSARANCVDAAAIFCNTLENIRMASATSDCLVQTTNGVITCINCKFSGAGDAGTDTTGNASQYMYGCEFASNTNEGYCNSNSYNTLIVNCYSHDNGSYGFDSGSGTVYGFINSISDTNVTYGLRTRTAILVLNSVFYNNTGATAVGCSNTPTGAVTTVPLYLNNIFLENGKYGLDVGTASRMYVIADYNVNHGNGTAAYNNINGQGANNSIADPLFTSETTGDFTLQAGSPALNTGVDAGVHTTVVV